MRLRRFLISEPIRLGHAIGRGNTRHRADTGDRRHLQTVRGRLMVGQRFLVPCRGSNPLPGAMSNFCDRARGRRRHAHAVRPAEAAPHDLRAGDGPPRHPRARTPATERTALVVGHGAEQVTKKVQQIAPDWANVAFVEQVEQNGTGDAATIGMTAFSGDDYDDDDSTVVVAPRRHAAAAARDAAPNSSTTHVANAATRRRCSRAWSTTRPATAASSARTTVRRRASSSTATLRPTSSTSTRSARASTPSVATCSARRCASCTPDNAQGEYYLTDVDLGARPRWVTASAACRHRPTRRRASTTGGSWRMAERELRSRTNRRWLLQRRHDARPAPDVHRRHRAARPRRHPLPGHDPAGDDGRRRRLRDRPRHPARRLQRRRRARSSSTPSATMPRSAPMPSSDRTHIYRGFRRSPRPPRPARSTLHPSADLAPTSIGPTASGEDVRTHGEGHHQAARALLGSNAPRARAGGGDAPQHRAGPRQPRRVRQRRGACCRFGEIDPRLRRLRHPESLRRRRPPSTTRSWSS